MKTFAYVYCVAGLADLLLTEAGIHLGYHEDNPLFAWLMGYGDIWVIAKGLGTVVVCYGLFRIAPKVRKDTLLNRVLVTICVLFLVSLQVGVVFWNAHLLRNI